MTYSNPFQGAMNPFLAQMQPQMQQRQPIDQQQFRQFAITLNDDALTRFAQMARQQGISEQDIQQGIQFIKSM